MHDQLNLHNYYSWNQPLRLGVPSVKQSMLILVHCAYGCFACIASFHIILYSCIAMRYSSCICTCIHIIHIRLLTTVISRAGVWFSIKMKTVYR
ncbi:hypothetical protein U9M48_025205 [Paspalum notatum var. saurae]|uniref:Uncharacterized protein n=1 Tax=Paspalum notatum var. saurae TaxID=547442 RepID=A0AAQ3TPM1_PASNO